MKLIRFFTLVLMGMFLLLVSAYAIPTSGLTPKNVIIINADGMGYEHVKAARIFAYGDAIGTVNPFNFEQFPNKNSIMTQTVSGGTTDSAAASSAMATGRKYASGTISWSAGNITTALEIYKARGKRTGLVTTYTPINDATPAGFGAHNISRNNMADIANQYFQTTKPNVLFGESGDGITPAAAQAAGYTVVQTAAELGTLNTETETYVSGQFAEHSNPSLAQRVATALGILDNDPDGFFCLIEHEGTDEGSHNSNLALVINSVIELEAAVDAILDWAKGRNDTLIILLADHETGGLQITETTPSQYEIPTHTWTSPNSHTSANTPLYAIGASSPQVVRTCSVDNTDIFRFLTTMPSPIVTRTRVNGSADDAEENVSTYAMDVTSSDLELAYDTGLVRNQLVGMRFQSIPIPKGSLITNAYIQFKTDEITSGTTAITIKAQNAANAAAFTTTAHDISNRALTTSSVVWNSIPGWQTEGEEAANQRTPEIKSIVQEVVDRTDWSAGNAMAVIMSGSGTRIAEAYDGDVLGAPELVVEWLPPHKLFWGTYLGGSGPDEAYAVAMAPDGNIVVGGRNALGDFLVDHAFDMTYNGDFDGWIAKFTPDGALLWSTYLGGSGGDYVKGLTVDDQGNIFACGSTSSYNFPVLQGSQRYGFDTTMSGGDGFIAKFTPNGFLAWATYIGGTNGDSTSDIAVDPYGDVYVTGTTASADLPVMGSEGSGWDTTMDGSEDAFVIKVTSAGDFAWGSFIGGSSIGGSFAEGGSGIDISTDGSVWIIGTTSSIDFPVFGGFGSTYNGDYDAFVAKINPATRQLSWSGYIGGNSEDMGKGIAVDNDGNAWICGNAKSNNMPVYSGIERNGYDTTYNNYNEAFAAKITPAGQLAWCTYLGCDGSESSIAIDPHGNALIGAETWGATSLPTTGVEGTGFKAVSGFPTESFVLKLTSAGDLAWGTYLGGGAYDLGGAIASDAEGRAVVAGLTTSSDFPTPNGFDTTYSSGNYYGDGYLCVIGRSAEKRVEQRVAASSSPSTTNNDAEESATGVMSLTSSDIELVLDGSIQKVGIRFANLGIPKNAIITKAFIQFSVDDEVMSAATSLTIKGQAIDNSPMFTTAANNVSSRATTLASLFWAPPAWSRTNAVCPDQRTPDVRGIVQEIVNRAGWAPDNGLSFIITGTGRRNAWAVEGNASRAALLHVEWIPKP